MLGNRLRYLLLMATSGLLLILYNKYYIGMIFLTILILPFFLFGLLSYSYGNIRAELASSVHVADKNDKIPVTIRLTNKTVFPVSCIRLYLTCQNTHSGVKHKKTIDASIDYKTKTNIICYISSQYAGNMEITLEGCRIYDYMKLFSLRQKQNAVIKIAVMPSFYELENIGCTNKNTGSLENNHYSAFHKGDDPSEVFEIREYREGDRLQRIHWKLSRKQDKLMIKEFSEPVSCSVLIYVHQRIPSGEKALFFTDAILECALSLSYSFLMKGWIHYLAWYDQEANACRRVCIAQETDLFEAIDGLLQACPCTDSLDELAAYQAQYPQEQYSDMYLIGTEASGVLLDSMTALKAGTRQLICIRNQGDKPGRSWSGEWMKQHRENGVDVLPVDAGDLRNGMEQLGSVG